MFLRRTPGQTFAQALDARADAEPAPLGEAELAVAAALRARAEAVLGGTVESHQSLDVVELTHEPTGIQLSFFGAEAGLSVPYWYVGDAATHIVTQLYALAREVEEATGLEGFDEQLGEPVATADAEAAAALFAQTGGIMARFAPGTG